MSGTVTLDDVFLGSADAALAFNGVTVGGTPTGAYTGTAGTAVTWSAFGWNPATTPVTPLWTFTTGGRTYSFDLTTVSIAGQNNFFLNLLGTGTLRITGGGPSYDPTPGTWSFTISNPDGADHQNFQFTFANSQTASGVPEGGTTAMLLGAALCGIGLIRRKFAA